MKIYYSGQHGLVGLISGDKMPYSWIFSISNIIIALLCVVIIFVIIKRLKIKYTITKKELSLCNVILYIIKFHNIPPIKYFYLPLLFIVSVYIGIYENMYLKNIKNINNWTDYKNVQKKENKNRLNNNIKRYELITRIFF